MKPAQVNIVIYAKRMKMSEPIHKRIAEFIEAQIMGCRFVGIGDDGEVFVSFEHDDEGLAREAIRALRVEFSEVTRVTTVHSVSLEEVTQLVEGLNKAIEDLEEEERGESKPNLLDIGKF